MNLTTAAVLVEVDGICGGIEEESLKECLSINLIVHRCKVEKEIYL